KSCFMPGIVAHACCTSTGDSDKREFMSKAKLSYIVSPPPKKKEMGNNKNSSSKEIHDLIMII
ncbi:hypothetical protein ACQP3F_32380, partial [Escherichia coli]